MTAHELVLELTHLKSLPIIKENMKKGQAC